MSRGVLFIATGGDEYLRLAELAADSVRKHNPGLPIHFHAENGHGWLDSRLVKLSMDKLTPFQHTIYLDCDVLVQSSLVPLFGFCRPDPGVAMALDEGAKTANDVLWHRFFLKIVPQPILRNFERFVPKWAPHFNSGVISFIKNEASALFFERWRRVWASRPPCQDQLALMESCAMSKVWPSLIPGEWNYQHCITKKLGDLQFDAPAIKVLHLAGREKAELYARARIAGLS